MANKRFTKPIRPNPSVPAIADWGSIAANRDIIARDEYRYCMREAKRQHPEWTLRERQAYAQRAASEMFE